MEVRAVEGEDRVRGVMDLLGEMGHRKGEAVAVAVGTGWCLAAGIENDGLPRKDRRQAMVYRFEDKLPVAAIRNQAGKFVTPTIESTTAAAAAVTDMPADFRVSLTNPPGAEVYPIASFTWLLVYKDQPDEAKGRAMVKFLWWATHEGQQYPKDLLYAPLPPTVVKRIEATLREIRFQGKPLLTAAQ